MCFLSQMLTSDSSSLLTKNLRLVKLTCLYIYIIFFDRRQYRSFPVLRNLLQLCTSKEFHGTCVLVAVLVAVYHITFSKYLFCKVMHSRLKKTRITTRHIGLLGRLRKYLQPTDSVSSSVSKQLVSKFR